VGLLRGHWWAWNLCSHLPAAAVARVATSPALLGYVNGAITVAMVTQPRQNRRSNYRYTGTGAGAGYTGTGEGAAVCGTRS